MRSPLLAPIAISLLAAGGAGAQPAPAVNDATPVAVIVKVPKPWYAPRSVVVGKMRDTIPQYESLAGLSHKMFSFAQADSQFGGIYLWKDRASAQAWFNPAWFERVRRERGVEGNVRFLDAPVILDNAGASAAGSREGTAVATLVTIPIPPGVGRERLVAEFRAAVPVYRKVAGLARKYFIVTDDGRFGGIYLWESQASADAWFNPAWHARVKSTYGADAAIEGFDIPILLSSRLADNRIETAQP